MSENLQLPYGIFGIGQGLMPKRGPKTLLVQLDLTAGPATIDFTTEVMRDVIEFVQSVAADNSPNNTALTLLCSVTQHRIIVPPQSQGIFGIIAPRGPFMIQATGPAAKFNLNFMNMPFAPSVYKVT